MPRSPVAVLVSFFLGAGITLGVHALAAGSAGSGPHRSALPAIEPGGFPESPPGRGEVGTALEGLSLRIDSLSERIGELEEAFASRGDRRIASTPDGDSETERLEALVSGLQESLDRLADEVRGSDRQATALQRMMNEHPEPNWVAPDELRETYLQDEERARMEVQLLTYARVVERYGKPQLTRGRGSEVSWIYGRDYFPESDSYRLQLRFRFQDGIVTGFYVEGG